MSQQDDLFDYDEGDSVKFIRNYLPQELKEKFSDDDINYIIDLIYEYYEEKGFMDDEADDEVNIDEDELIDYVIKNAKRNGFTNFEPDEIQFVVQGELGYCDSLGMFDGKKTLKADPYGFQAELRPNNASVVADISDFKWHDSRWMKKREKFDDKKKDYIIVFSNRVYIFISDDIGFFPR